MENPQYVAFIGFNGEHDMDIEKKRKKILMVMNIALRGIYMILNIASIILGSAYYGIPCADKYVLYLLAAGCVSITYNICEIIYRILSYHTGMKRPNFYIVIEIIFSAFIISWTGLGIYWVYPPIFSGHNSACLQATYIYTAVMIGLTFGLILVKVIMSMYKMIKHEKD